MKFLMMLCSLTLLSMVLNFHCKFSQKPNVPICWGVSYLCQLEHLIVDNPTVLNQIEELQLDEASAKAKICQKVEKYTIKLKSPKSCLNILTSKNFKLIYTSSK